MPSLLFGMGSWPKLWGKEGIWAKISRVFGLRVKGMKREDEGVKNDLEKCL